MTRTMPHYIRLLYAFFLWLLSVNALHAAVFHRAGLEWYSQESEHFQIHFHDGLQTQARKVLDVAERVHARLSRYLQWQPQARTEIVLTDEYDVANGYASPYPANRMTLYLSAPDEINGLEDYGDWLELVFTHEYLHILHLDKANGSPESLRHIFGRFLLLFPNVFQPSWFIEGLATHVETDRQRGVGRGQSSYFDMLMRMETLHGLKPLRQVNQPLASWPMGTTPYLYGVFFYHFLADRYGEEKIQQLVNHYSGNLIPFSINSNTRQVLGKDLDQLWAEFHGYLETRYERQREQVRAAGESSGLRLTRSGYYDGPLTQGNDGTLYYIEYNARQRPALVRLASNGQPERLAEVGFGSRIALHPRQGVLLSEPEICGNADYFYDLYRYDLNGRHKRRLTECGRYRMAIWSPSGDAIIAVHNAGGQNALHLLDPNGRRTALLWQGKRGEVISHIDWSPDGKRLIAALWQPGQGWDLSRFDLATRQWSAVTHTRGIENHPRFCADGTHILFSADYNGIYNIYRMALDTGRTERLTNVMGGAFFPQLSPDATTLSYIGYSEEGFDLYSLPLADNPLPLVEPEQGSSAISPAPPPETEVGKSHDYSPYRSVRPTWWFPSIYVDQDRSEIGFITGGNDTLQRHNYALGLGYDVQNEWGLGNFDYIYDRYTPIVKLHLDNSYKHYYNSNDEPLKVRAQSNVQAAVVVPWLHRDSRWALHLGVGEENENDARLNNGALPEPDYRDRIAGMAVSYASAQEFPRGISREDGREAMLVAESSDALAGGDFTGTAYTLDWKEFLRLGGEHVLGLRLLGAEGEVGIRPFNLGGSAEVNPLPQILDSPAANSPFNRRQYALRGYDEGLPQLTGTSMRLASLEYRFPLMRVERGWMAPPLGLHQLHGALFTETGAVWSEGQAQDDYYSSYGLELKADVVLFYSMMFRLSAGYAHGIERGGEDQFYLRLGGAF